jgi:glutamate-1-semialdehyde 2,1-aminomutase/spore coat polysaccharide biosynthesis protein SpsF
MPDLTALAKGISNGIPLSAIVGKKEYMFALEKTFFSFTYGGECLGLAAAKACIPKIRDEDVPAHLDRVGRHLKDGFNALAVENGLADVVECIGYPCRSIIAIDGGPAFDTLEIKSYMQQELLRRGVLWTAYHSLAQAHNLEDIDYALGAYDETLGLLKKAMDSRRPLRSFIEGEPVKPVFRKVADFNAYIQQKGAKD